MFLKSMLSSNSKTKLQNKTSLKQITIKISPMCEKINNQMNNEIKNIKKKYYIVINVIIFLKKYFYYYIYQVLGFRPQALGLRTIYQQWQQQQQQQVANSKQQQQEQKQQPSRAGAFKTLLVTSLKAFMPKFNSQTSSCLYPPSPPHVCFNSVLPPPSIQLVSSRKYNLVLKIHALKQQQNKIAKQNQSQANHN